MILHLFIHLFILYPLKDIAADCVRIERMLYFGRDFLCGLDPPVLKLKFIAPSLSEYVSVVDSFSSSTASVHQRLSSNDPLVRNSPVVDFFLHFREIRLLAVRFLAPSSVPVDWPFISGIVASPGQSSRPSLLDSSAWPSPSLFRFDDVTLADGIINGQRKCQRQPVRDVSHHPYRGGATLITPKSWAVQLFYTFIHIRCIWRIQRRMIYGTRRLFLFLFILVLWGAHANSISRASSRSRASSAFHGQPAGTATTTISSQVTTLKKKIEEGSKEKPLECGRISLPHTHVHPHLLPPLYPNAPTSSNLKVDLKWAFCGFHVTFFSELSGIWRWVWKDKRKRLRRW